MVMLIPKTILTACQMRHWLSLSRLLRQVLRCVFIQALRFFKGVQHFDYDILAKRLRELSFLNSGVRIVLTDERTSTTQVFEHKGGLSEFVSYINGGKHTLNDIFHFTADGADGIGVEVALQWSDSYNEKVLCFTNNIPQKKMVGRTYLGFVQR